ncbi:flavodoxin family protein [Thermosulfuriphilus sp.]
MKVIAFNGSARKDGNTATMIRTVLEVLESHGIETEFIQLAGQSLQGCKACYKCLEKKNGRCAVEDDPINEYIEKIRNVQGLILGSPTYFADVSTNMKALIERCGMVARVNGDLFRRKIAAGVVAVRRAGAIHVFNSLNHFFLIGQMIVVGSSYWNMGRGKNPGEVRDDEEGMATMKTLGENMAWLLKKLYS